MSKRAVEWWALLGAAVWGTGCALSHDWLAVVTTVLLGAYIALAAAWHDLANDERELREIGGVEHE